MNEADCYSTDDRKLILQLVGERTTEVDNMIKRHMVSKSDEALLKGADFVLATPSPSAPSLEVIGKRQL